MYSLGEKHTIPAAAANCIYKLYLFKN